MGWWKKTIKDMVDDPPTVVEKKVQCEQCNGTTIRTTWRGKTVDCIFCVNGYRIIKVLR